MSFIWAALDESTDQKQRTVFAVAGWVTRQRHWTEIERKWQIRLDREGMKYFKTKEWKTLHGEFKRFRDKQKYPPPEGRNAANRVRDDLIAILRDSPVGGFGLGVLLKDYRSVRRSSRARKALAANPYEGTYLQMLIIIAGEVSDMPKPETVAFLIDEHNRAKNIEAAYDALKGANPICGQWMGSLTRMRDQDSPALQTADLLAGVCKDLFVEKIETPNHTPENDGFKLRFGGSVTVAYCDKPYLQLVVDANVLRNGKPHLGSTQQLKIFKEFLLKPNEKNRGQLGIQSLQRPSKARSVGSTRRAKGKARSGNKGKKAKA